MVKNNMEQEQNKPRPKVGDICTKIMLNDRYTYKVVEVCTPLRVRVKATHGDSVLISERSDGRWREVGGSSKGSHWVMEDRGEYICPEF